MWIRVETNVGQNDKLHRLAFVLGISTDTCLGHLVQCWGNVAEHRTDGDITGVLDSTFELWANWHGNGDFAKAFRELFVTDGQITGWRERQGKLIARQAADRNRKSKERPRKVQGTSTESPPLRNVTIQSISRFDEFWNVYPKRLGGNPKSAARETYQKRVRSGVTEGELVDGARRYAQHCDATQKTGTEYVKQAVTWLSPKSEGWKEAWVQSTNNNMRDLRSRPPEEEAA